MKDKFFHSVKASILIIILIFSASCATREDFNRHFIERYVDDGIYANELKGFSIAWPDEKIWEFKNYPEFDLSFDHIDGRSQVLVLGVNRLLRQAFPDGFEGWILDKIRADVLKHVSKVDLSSEDIGRFRVVLDCEFRLSLGESFGIQRKVDMMLFKKANSWVGVICICPQENYAEKKALFDEFFATVEMI